MSKTAENLVGDQAKHSVEISRCSPPLFHVWKACVQNGRTDGRTALPLSGRIRSVRPRPDASSLSESGFEAIPRHPNPPSLPPSIRRRNACNPLPPPRRPRAVVSPYSVSLLPPQPFITRLARCATIFCLNSYCVRCRSVALCMHGATTSPF